MVATLPKFFILKYGNTKAMLEKRKKKTKHTGGIYKYKEIGNVVL